jgi:hypothetical protein
MPYHVMDLTSLLSISRSTERSLLFLFGGLLLSILATNYIYLLIFLLLLLWWPLVA